MKCDGCEAEMTYEAVEFEVIVGGRLRLVAQPGWYCWACGISAHSASDLHAAEQALPVRRAKRLPSAWRHEKGRQPEQNVDAD